MATELYSIGPPPSDYTPGPEPVGNKSGKFRSNRPTGLWDSPSGEGWGASIGAYYYEHKGYLIQMDGEFTRKYLHKENAWKECRRVARLLHENMRPEREKDFDPSVGIYTSFVGSTNALRDRSYKDYATEFPPLSANPTDTECEHFWAYWIQNFINGGATNGFDSFYKIFKVMMKKKNPTYFTDEFWIQFENRRLDILTYSMQEMTMELNQLKNNMPFTIARYFKSSWIDIEPDVKSIVWFVNEALFGNSPNAIKFRQKYTSDGAFYGDSKSSLERMVDEYGPDMDDVRNAMVQNIVTQVSKLKNAVNSDEYDQCNKLQFHACTNLITVMRIARETPEGPQKMLQEIFNDSNDFFEQKMAELGERYLPPTPGPSGDIRTRIVKLKKLTMSAFKGLFGKKKKNSVLTKLAPAPATPAAGKTTKSVKNKLKGFGRGLTGTIRGMGGGGFPLIDLDAQDIFNNSLFELKDLCPMLYASIDTAGGCCVDDDDDDDDEITKYNSFHGADWSVAKIQEGEIYCIEDIIILLIVYVYFIYIVPKLEEGEPQFNLDGLLQQLCGEVDDTETKSYLDVIINQVENILIPDSRDSDWKVVEYRYSTYHLQDEWTDAIFSKPLETCHGADPSFSGIHPSDYVVHLLKRQGDDVIRASGRDPTKSAPTEEIMLELPYHEFPDIDWCLYDPYLNDQLDISADITFTEETEGEVSKEEKGRFHFKDPRVYGPASKEFGNILPVSAVGSFTDFPPDGPTHGALPDGPFTDFPPDGPTHGALPDGPFTDFPPDGPTHGALPDGPFTGVPPDGPTHGALPDGPFTDFAMRPTSSSGQFSDSSDSSLGGWSDSSDWALEDWSDSSDWALESTDSDRYTGVDKGGLGEIRPNYFEFETHGELPVVTSERNNPRRARNSKTTKKNQNPSTPRMTTVPRRPIKSGELGRDARRVTRDPFRKRIQGRRADLHKAFRKIEGKDDENQFIVPEDLLSGSEDDGTRRTGSDELRPIGLDSFIGLDPHQVATGNYMIPDPDELGGGGGVGEPPKKKSVRKKKKKTNKKSKKKIIKKKTNKKSKKKIIKKKSFKKSSKRNTLKKSKRKNKK
jgi:hypothetical protein